MCPLQLSGSVEYCTIALMITRTKWRVAVLLLLVAGVTLLHYTTSVQMENYHGIYRRLYYLPIILGGLWFGLRGGVATALGVSVIYAPHVIFQWGHHPSTSLDQYLEIMLYNGIGFLTGLLSSRQQDETERHRKTATSLEESYHHLREQADQILEIEEQLRRADRLSALGELSAGMAHEIRNPLGSIRGTAEILRDGVPQDDPRLEFADILLKEVDRLNKVVQDFLDFARPGDPPMSHADLNRAIDEVVLLLGKQAEKAGVRMRFDAGETPDLCGDIEKLKQVVLNLALNALQAMPDGGHLDIATESRDDRIHLILRDSGGGIPAGQLEKIFNPFFTTRDDGTGLGLAITHRIVQQHQGTIRVESEPGAGTCFKLEFPCRGHEE